MKDNSINDIGYEALSPKADIKNGSAYLEAIDWAINNKDVKNVALAGPYGSGKSSIIKYYLEKNGKIKALNISLAIFNSGKNKPETVTLNKENVKEENKRQNEIELGILKQLFYKTDSKKIPQSRYKKIQKKYYKNYFIGTLAIATFIISGIAFFVPDSTKSLLSVIDYSRNAYGMPIKLVYIIALLFGLVGIGIIAYTLRWITSKIKVKEINFWGKLIADSDNNEGSIFDKTMDEIIYFFEATDYEVVFIEDLDRFDNLEIFIKLRELNNILNNCELIKRKITFVYAVRDDMFEMEERTKFFDFIIPVIPFINSTNSMEILLEKFVTIKCYRIIKYKKKVLKIRKAKENVENIKEQSKKRLKETLYNITQDFITEISIFIEDMRFLSNVCNEFAFYKKALNNVKLDDKKLFSIMLFKSAFPNYFADLEKEKGIVKQAFDEKEKYIERKKKELARFKTKGYENEIEQLNISRSLKEFISEYRNEKIFSEAITENKILWFLLKEGYIAEDYADYINYFYPKSITKKEKDFISGVRLEQAANNYSEHIKNVRQVCNRLLDYEFRRKEMLNFDIVDYLITQKSESEKCKKLFEGLSENDELIKFSKAYIKRGNNLERYIKLACMYCNDFWHIILNADNKVLAEEEKVEYLSYIFRYAYDIYEDNPTCYIEKQNNDSYDEKEVYIGEDEEEYDLPDDKGIEGFVRKHQKELREELSDISEEQWAEIMESIEIYGDGASD